MEKNTVKCLYWNIHGISSKILGDKNKDPDFLKVISSFDIIGISELHTKNTISIPGFYLKKQKFRTKKHKGPKIGGGIAVYVKQNIANNFRIIPNDNVDSIWLRTSLGCNEEARFGFYYCSPEGKENSDFLEKVGGEIQNFSTTKNTYIFGDFNARTKTVSENIAQDKFDENLGIVNSLESIPIIRNSEDTKIVNKRGKDFLDICRVNDLSIVNGRTVGDIFGKYTCHQKRGSSVIDYLLTPCQNLRNISDFTVGEHHPLLSDHCPIMANIQLKSALKIESETIKLESLPDSFLWDENSSQVFTEKLQSEQSQEKVQKLMRNPNLKMEDVKEFILDTAKESKIRKTNNKKRKIRKKENKPWFDEECQNIKREITKDGKMLRKTPSNIILREKIYVNKKSLRNMLKKKKNAYQTKIIDEMCKDLSNKDQKKYWKQLCKLEKSRDENSYIPDITMINHFKELLQTDENMIIEDDSSTVSSGNLDYPITKKELEVASKILKAGKGTGIDTIRNEMIAPLIEAYPMLVIRAFNDTLINTKPLCTDWLHSLITAIHKKGAKDDPGNYRGISLMSCLGKLFLTIINNRLMKYSLEKGLLSPGQLGFVSGNRTSDPHIILHNLIQKYAHRKKVKFFGCFVDFSKAFDKVPRNILLQKLRNKGINGRIFEIIKSLYMKDTASVKIGKKFSPPFNTNIGVRQGCVLSPLLFNLFLSDLESLLKECGDNVKVDNASEISCLMWADDILIFSETEAGLQRKLNKLESYCEANKLSVNTDKTQCMIFNKTGRLEKKHDFDFNKKKLACVREYKYLGFLVTPSGEIKSGLEDLRIRSLKAFAKLKKALGIHFRHNISNTIHLFNYMIKPILLYCSDFWGCLKHPKNSPIENLYTSFCKQLLGVRKQTSTNGVLQELGMSPLQHQGTKMAIKNWERIHNQKANPILIASHMDAIQRDLPWESSIRQVFASNGLLDLYLSKRDNSDDKLSIANILLKRQLDQFNQIAQETIEGSNKLRMLNLLKQNPGREAYLTDITNSNHRRALTKFRLSSHTLEIERGRYNQTPPEKRFCIYCKNMTGKEAVENEEHFLFHCPMSKELRIKYLPKSVIENICLTDKQKLIHIMTNKNISTTAKYIFLASEHRKTTLDVLKFMQDLITEVASLDRNSIKESYEITKVSNDGLKIVITKTQLLD